MSELLDLARQAALDAGTLACERLGQERDIATKSSSIDLVTDVDRAAEAVVIERIQSARPDDAILSEEAGEVGKGRTGVCWIIDPIDGTTNYAHAVPHFSVSIGVEVDGIREAGVVYNPMLEEIFYAERGKGAYLNGRLLRVSSVATCDRALLATGFAYDVHRADEDNLDHFIAFIRCAQAVRRAGSAALDFAYVAAGRYDGYWERHLRPWDVAAGILLVEEAGGVVTDYAGAPAPRSGAQSIAANPLLHREMLSVLRATPR